MLAKSEILLEGFEESVIKDWNHTTDLLGMAQKIVWDYTATTAAALLIVAMSNPTQTQGSNSFKILQLSKKGLLILKSLHSCWRSLSSQVCSNHLQTIYQELMHSSWQHPFRYTFCQVSKALNKGNPQKMKQWIQYHSKCSTMKSK